MYGVNKVVTLENGVFMVRFRSVEDREKALNAGPILHDRKPIFMNT